jgi:hypothetical protein
MLADVTPTDPVNVWVPVAEDTVGFVTDSPATALENVIEEIAPPPSTTVPAGALIGLPLATVIP